MVPLTAFLWRRPIEPSVQGPWREPVSAQTSPPRSHWPEVDAHWNSCCKTTVRHMDYGNLCASLSHPTSLAGVAQPRAEFAHCEDGLGVAATLCRVRLSLVWMQTDFKLTSEGKAFFRICHVLRESVFGTTFWKLGPCTWSLAQNPGVIPRLM